MANNWAIVVGINDYDFLPNSSLKFAVADAVAIRSFFCDNADFKPEQVLFCGDGTEGSKKATRSELRDILRHQLQRARDADNLWFFFSGHGIVGSDRQDYLMTIDGNPNDLEDTAIPIHFVTAQLRACRAKNIVLVLDMCRSERPETGRKGAELSKSSWQDLVLDREGQQGIVTLFSCQHGQSSYELKELQQGAFTYALLEGLCQHRILRDLARYLERRVPELHQAAGKVRKQVPLVIPAPDWKLDEPILSHFEPKIDVSRLMDLAIDAECDDDLPMALRLWERINLLATKPEDRSRALKKITDLVRRSHSQSQLTEFFDGMPDFLAIYKAARGEDNDSTEILLPKTDLEGPKPEPPTRKPSAPPSPDPKPATSKVPAQLPLDTIPLDSEKGVDYRKLRDLLKAGQWKEADEETLQVMLKAANRVSDGWLDAASLKNFPCKDLKTIDQLWVTASDGHFGFSVQKKIWEDCDRPTSAGKNWDQFSVKVGWQNKKATAYVNYSDLNFNPFLSPKGESPILVGWYMITRLKQTYWYSFLVQRLVSCSTKQF
jgi:hypothetical protein